MSGDGVYGIAAAAEHYFSEPVGHLDLAQAAAFAFRAAFGRPLAGKTGTTTGFGDAWFTGFTPRLATSVWVGDPARQVPMPDLAGGGPLYGGTFPALIFRQFMSGSLAGQPVTGLPGRAPTAGLPGAALTAGQAGAIRRHHHDRG